MPAQPANTQLVFGRESERKRFERMLKGRAGGRLGFSGIGGIGKSTLLRQLDADACRLQITDYIAAIDLAAAQITPETPLRSVATELDFLSAIITALEATGKTTRQRLLRTHDSLADVKRLRDALLAQPAQVIVQPNFNVEASNESSVGGIRVDIPVTTRGATVTIDQLRSALVRAIKLELPYLVRPMPENNTILPRRLVVLFVDNIGRAGRAVQQALRDLAGSLPENLLLVCAGRDEDRQGVPDHEVLLPGALPKLEPLDIHAWLTSCGIRDQGLHTAIASLSDGIPLLVSLAIAQITAAEAQGHALTAADFQLSGVVNREIATDYLVKRYLERLDQGTPQDRQLRDLILYGCVLRRFEPLESVRAIGAVTGDVGALIRTLEQRGFLSKLRMHHVLQYAARAYLQINEPERYKELVAAAVRYYEARGSAHAADIYHVQLLQGLPDAEVQLLARVAERLAVGDIHVADELVAVAQAAASEPQLAWAITLAKADLATGEGATALAEQWLLEILNTPDRPEWVDAELQQRIPIIPSLQRFPVFQLWVIERQAPSLESVVVLLRFGSEMNDHYNWRVAQRAYQIAFGKAEIIDDRQNQANALLGLGDIAERRNDLVAAERYLKDALALYQALDDRLDQAIALYRLGDVAKRRSDLAAAECYFEDALALFQALDERLGQANAFCGLGDVALQRNDLVAAERYYKDALALYQALGASLGQANMLRSLGDIAQQRNDLAVAERYLKHALALYQALDVRLNQANALRSLGNFSLRRNDLAAAERYFKDALALYQALDAHLGQANALCGLGEVALKRGREIQAQEYAQQSLTLAQNIESLITQYHALNLLRQVAEAQGDLVEAGRYRVGAQYIQAELRKRN